MILQIIDYHSIVKFSVLTSAICSFVSCRNASRHIFWSAHAVLSQVKLGTMKDEMLCPPWFQS